MQPFVASLPRPNSSPAPKRSWRRPSTRPDCTSILQAEAIMSRWNRRLLRRGEARSLIDNLVAGPTGGALTELDKAELEKFREVLAPKRAYDLMPA